MIQPLLRFSIVRRVLSLLGTLGAIASLTACNRAGSVPQGERFPATDTAMGSMPGDSALNFPIMPDPGKTPGATLDVTEADVCVPGYAGRVRNVPTSVKREAYASYGIRTHEPGEYEVDHLISLKLGGSNSIRNLWPESFRTQPWNAYVKDALEDELYRRVCAGALSLTTAQQVIARNWVAGYRRYVSPNPLPAGPHAENRGRSRWRSHRHYTPRSQPNGEAPVP
ncbi:MAG: HNH endonuclease [Gemmatimonadota bacterium]